MPGTFTRKDDQTMTNTSTSTYEDIMGITTKASTTGSSPVIEETDSKVKAIEALSKRLKDFRQWCIKDAKIRIHSSICIVNGEATDGTKNAPVFAFGPPSGTKSTATTTISSSSTTATTATAASKTTATQQSIAQGRIGMVDGVADRSLYERTMGCQIWTTKEIKKDEIMMTCPRSAMITPDLVAASDAGRAILACCATINRDDTTKEHDQKIDFWDVFENTTICESKFALKTARNPGGTQLLVKILRERDLAEKAYTKTMKAINSSEFQEQTDTKYVLAPTGLISTRAPFLAFLIHQRFSSQVSPPVVSQSNSDIEKIIKEDGNINAINTVREIRTLSDIPVTFGPYARILPSSVSLPICWKRHELALLSGCIPGLQPLQEIAATTMQLAAEFTSLINAGILTRFPSIFPPGMITWERWVWAASVFTSRILPASVYLNKGEQKAALRSSYNNDHSLHSPAHVWDEVGVMVPFLDMINHEVDAQCIAWQQNVPENNFGEISDKEEHHPPRAAFTRRVKKQQQVYFAYGGDDLSSRKMIIQYGFAQMLNPADAAILGWGLIDAVGGIPSPADYAPLLEDLEEDIPHLVYESTDDTAVNEWWSDERLDLLENEAFPAVDDAFMSSLKMGKKMTGSAHSDGLYDPILLTVSLVSTTPVPELQQFAQKKKKTDNEKVSITVSKRHQRILRSYLLFLFTRKLEKLLENLNKGLKTHYGSLNLWTKASEGGIRYTAKDLEDVGEKHVGWQVFFDQHAYASTVEVENHYYALAPDSCVLTLYDGQLQSLQTSIDGLLSMEKFQAGVLKQLEDLGFIILTGDDDNLSRSNQDKDRAGMNGKAGTANEGRKGESRKGDAGKSPKRKRNRKRNNSNTSITGDRPPAIKLHVGNLSFSTTPSDLFEFFSRAYGRDNVLKCHIPAERTTGKSRGFGFVTLPEQIAREILTSGRKCEIKGRVLKIAESNSAGTNKPNRHPEAPPPISNDRCSVCGYRPKYCVCPNGPSIPGLHVRNGPGYGPGMDPASDYARGYDYYGRDRYRSDHRSRSRSPRHRRRSRSDRDDYYRNHSRDRNDHYRGYSRERDRSYHDHDRSPSRSRSRGRERRRDSRKRRRDEERRRSSSSSNYDYSLSPQSPRSDRKRSPRSPRNDHKRSPSPLSPRSEHKRSPSPRSPRSDRKRSPSPRSPRSDRKRYESRKRRSRSRERSRKSRKKKRRARSRSRSASPESPVKK